MLNVTSTNYNLNTGAAESRLKPFKPEQVLTCEGGFKTMLFDRHLRFNAAGFYYDYRDQQLPGSIPVPPYDVPGGYVNAPRSYICGGGIRYRSAPLSRPDSDTELQLPERRL
nr:TonB-dependent receptor [Acetobacter fallax]